jgi:phosphoribosylanthranilate isomerase
VEVIKTISIKDKSSFETAKLFENVCDLFLFDTQSEHYGGTGKTFDWQWLEEYTLDKPFYLSGGISLENFEEIKKIKHGKLTGIDINSKFEIRPGIKDIEKIKQLIYLMNN